MCNRGIRSIPLWRDSTSNWPWHWIKSILSILQVEGRGAYTAILFSDILMLARDLSHEIADRLAVKVFFTNRSVLSWPVVNSSILNSKGRQIKKPPPRSKIRTFLLTSTLSRPSGIGSWFTDSYEHSETSSGGSAFGGLKLEIIKVTGVWVWCVSQWLQSRLLKFSPLFSRPEVCGRQISKMPPKKLCSWYSLLCNPFPWTVGWD